MNNSIGRLRKPEYFDELSKEEQKKIRKWELVPTKYKDGTVRIRVYRSNAKPAYYCFLRDNQILKKVIRERKVEVGCKWGEIERMMGIKSSIGRRSWRYLRGYRSALTQMQVLMACEILGIEVELKITKLDKWKEIPRS